ncbi:hypothetical protein J437_LFUL016554 [Ladona fulva]|uniref:Uncharacterized protein n=1 Tax=Ladona fulva TaxID=123851 RepID=A0A8K0KN48_LADFU|nr:hypothetical protein J437_LFUL016553 [Ladona fulva]KAG8237353.1 hypothetical protein J437_LFUL016554 [Ladona fulva]
MNLEQYYKSQQKYYRGGRKNPREMFQDRDANEVVVQDIFWKEVKCALRKMKNGKVFGSDQILVEVLKSLGYEKIYIPRDLMGKILHQE